MEEQDDRPARFCRHVPDNDFFAIVGRQHPFFGFGETGCGRGRAPGRRNRK
jgi:hypothetical protein